MVRYQKLTDRKVLRRYSLPKIIGLSALAIVIIVLISSLLIVKFEAPYPATKIHTFSDGLWWAAVGISTIGIGTIVPASAAGKILNIFLMVSGLGLFSVITAVIASLITETDVEADLRDGRRQIQATIRREELVVEGEDQDILAELKKIDSRLRAIEAGRNRSTPRSRRRLRQAS